MSQRCSVPILLESRFQNESSISISSMPQTELKHLLDLYYSYSEQCHLQGYIVLNRPWAFVQWLEKATIDEE